MSQQSDELRQAIELANRRREEDRRRLESGNIPEPPEYLRRYIEQQTRRYAAQARDLTWQCMFCGKIHEPTLLDHPLTPGRKTPIKIESCDCDQSIIAAEEARLQVEAVRFQQHADALDYHPEFIKWDPEWPTDEAARGLLRQAKTRIRRWYLETFQGKAEGLALAGAYGVGKSTLLRAVVGAYGARGVKTAFYDEAAILDQLESVEQKEFLLMSCREARVLVLDDIGRLEFDKYSGWKQNLLQSFYFRVLEYRAQKRPTLFSTNCLMGELEAKLGQAAADRLMGIIGGPGNYVALWDIPSYRRRGFP